jgi:hypothetical protein
MSPRDVASRSLRFLALFAVGRLLLPTPTHTALVSLHCTASRFSDILGFLVLGFYLLLNLNHVRCFIDWGRKLLMLSSWSCRFIYFCNLFLCVAVVVVVVVFCCRWRGFCRDMLMCPNEPGWSKMGTEFLCFTTLLCSCNGVACG